MGQIARARRIPGRLWNAWRLLFYSRSIPLLLAAERNHVTAAGLDFIGDGGEIKGLAVQFALATIALRPEQWTALRSIRALLRHGATIGVSESGRRIITLRGGLRFSIREISLTDNLNMLVERFVDEEYRSIEPANAVVIDIGSNIGDSAIYFLGRGAEKIYSFEPFPALVADLETNLKLNELQGRVSIQPVGIGDARGRRTARFDPQWPAVNSVEAPTGAERSEESVAVDIEPFSYVFSVIAKDFPGDRRPPLILKMDCEGCERTILARPENLQLFTHVDQCVIEFHFDVPDDLPAALGALGFNTKCERTPYGAELLFGWRLT